MCQLKMLVCFSHFGCASSLSYLCNGPTSLLLSSVTSCQTLYFIFVATYCWNGAKLSALYVDSNIHARRFGGNTTAHTQVTSATHPLPIQPPVVSDAMLYKLPCSHVRQLIRRTHKHERTENHLAQCLPRTGPDGLDACVLHVSVAGFDLLLII